MVEEGQVHLHGAVIHVHELDRAVDFYSELFGLQVARRDEDAALLTGQSGQCELALLHRPAAEHPTGGVGVQAMVWQVPTPQALAEHEQRLWALAGHADRREHGSLSVVTGHDPDRQRLLLVCPPAASELPAELPMEVFVW